ncbi:MAG: hypothetical protein GWO02_23305 [Gammaproteobacteria bacterium]|nr:hypothetical protein [Gammaproteobacteria bacterium]
MNEERFNTDVRRFLKKVGITAQGEIEKAVEAAVRSGAIDEAAVLRARVHLRLEDGGTGPLVETDIDGEIRLG